MNIIGNLITGIIHLAFAAMDLLMLMILIKVIYNRWHPAWLRPIAATVEPAITAAATSVNRLAVKLTGKAYSRKASLIMLIVGLWVIRFVIVSLAR